MITMFWLPWRSWTIQALSGLRPRLLAEPMVTSAMGGGVLLCRWRWAVARHVGEQYLAGRPVVAGVIGFSQSGRVQVAAGFGVSLRNVSVMVWG